ncbi:MAG TPA: 50S ribosomal protein L11 methyltransferase [Burkholderiales bacterium]|nr:50S ribosomal protein L11 methyltransferase [Burkholderiales bacterium]
MPWVSLNLEVDATWAESLADALLDCGALSVELTDADAGTPREAALFGEPGEATQTLWPRNLLSALFDSDADPAKVVTAACEAVGVPVPSELSTTPVGEQDWVRATQQQFGPIEISPRLCIVPSWCEPPIPTALVLRLDPGLAFGTGAHPTTWQCLRWLEEHLRPGQSVLDFGCGSGILAIAAKKLGAGRVAATDIDPRAMEASRRNACENGVLVDVLTLAALHGECFDVVVANILANPLKVLAPVLSQHTRPAGNVVLAGILQAQERSVRAAFAEWFDLTAVYPRDGWIGLAGQRKSQHDARSESAHRR